MSNTAIWISPIFRDRAIANLIWFPITAVMLSVMSHRLTWTNFVYCILVIRLCIGPPAQLSFWHWIFRTLLILDTSRYQTCKRNITKFQLLIKKHLIIPVTKMLSDLLNLSITFWHWKKSDYSWTRVYDYLGTFGTIVLFWVAIYMLYLSMPVQWSVHYQPTQGPNNPMLIV